MAAYGVSSGLFLARLVFYFPRVLDDLRDHGRGAGFFTIVAGSSVFGTQLIVVAGRVEPARWLWWVAIAFWVVILAIWRHVVRRFPFRYARNRAAMYTVATARFKGARTRLTPA